MSETKTTRRRAGMGRQGVAVFFENKLAVFGLSLVIFLVLFSFVGPLIYQSEQVHTNLAQVHIAPGKDGFILGTDGVGYDQGSLST